MKSHQLIERYQLQCASIRHHQRWHYGWLKACKCPQAK